MNKTIIIIFIIMLFSPMLLAGEAPKLVILDFGGGDNDAELREELSKSLRRELSSSPKYTIVKGKEVDRAIKEVTGSSTKSCRNKACAVNVGKLLGANKVFAGDVFRKEKTLILVLRIVNIDLNKLEYILREKIGLDTDRDDAMKTIAGKILENTGVTGPPAKLMTSEDGKVVLLTWSPVRRAQRYHVFRSTSEDGPYDEVGRTGVSYFQDRKAARGKRYWYRVKSWRVDGFSDFSETVSTYAKKPVAGYVFRSFVPGWAQVYAGKKRGYVFAGTFAAGGIMTGLSGWYYYNSRKKYDELGSGTSSSTFDEKHKVYKRSGYILISTIAFTATVYVASWIDAMFIVRPSFAKIAEGGDGDSGSVNYFVRCSLDKGPERTFLAGASMRF
jgi:hypothetical protein